MRKPVEIFHEKYIYHEIQPSPIPFVWCESLGFYLDFSTERGRAFAKHFIAKYCCAGYPFNSELKRLDAALEVLDRMNPETKSHAPEWGFLFGGYNIIQDRKNAYLIKSAIS